MTTYIVTGTFNSVTEMVEHLQSEDHQVTVVANLPDFPGFDRWHDALVVRKVDYIDEYSDTDDVLIDWIAALLVALAPSGKPR